MEACQKNITHLLLIFALLSLSGTSASAQQAQAATSDSDPAAERAEDAVIAESEQQQAREREKTAEEDPLQQVEQSKVDTPTEKVTRPNELGAYTSIRLRYRRSGDDHQFDDGGSRVGAYGDWQFRPGYRLGGRLEVGFNVLDRLDAILEPGANSANGDDDIFLRLLYANLETPYGFAILGKAWSTYYKVAGFTDRFAGTGGSASGAYNAGTDGGPSGTGRADEILQSRILIRPVTRLFRRLKPFNLNFQLQNSQPIPLTRSGDETAGDEISYRYGFGLSALLETRDDLTLGIAYNYADVRNQDLTRLKRYGIDGDDEALLVGVKWFSDKWYLASSLSWLRNHMTTDTGIFFDGHGWETYGQYNPTGRWWLTGGWNYLQPNDNQPRAGNYQVKYAVLGLRYSIKTFERMLYANIRFDAGTLADSEPTSLGNTYTIGIRWNYP